MGYNSVADHTGRSSFV